MASTPPTARGYSRVPAWTRATRVDYDLAPTQMPLSPRSVLTDLVLTLALSALGLALRWPQLGRIPRLTDETAEVAGALAILAGARPLADVDAYRGPFWSYLLAGVLHVTGGGPMVPAVFAAVLGALTVGAVYLLGRAVAGRPAGVVASLLMATSFSHIVLNSHVVWSNNSTPLWTTLAALFLFLGSARQHPTRGAGFALIIAGALWGLALHTHPSVLALLVGAAAWVCFALRRGRVRPVALGVASLAFVTVMSPLIVFNVQTGLRSLEEATKPSHPLATDRGPVAVAARVRDLTGQLGRMAGAGVPGQPGDDLSVPLLAVTDAVRPLAVALFAAALVGALAVATWRGPRLIGFLAWPSMPILAAIATGFDSLYDTRYVGFLMPLAYVALGAAAAPWLSRRGPRGEFAALTLALMTLYPLVSVSAYYVRESAMGRTNDPMRHVSEWLAEGDTGHGQYVFVDKAMRPIKLGGGGDPTRAFQQLLTLRRVRHELSDTDEIRWFFLNDQDTTYYVVAADHTAAALEREFTLASRAFGDGWRVLERPGERSVGKVTEAPVISPAPVAVIERLTRQDSPDRHVFVDRDLAQIETTADNLLEVFNHQLGLATIAHTLADIDEVRWFLLADRHSTFVILAAAETGATLTREFDLIERERGDGWVVLERLGAR